ncbi:NmrA/HSCARG family protein [Actinoalloteichus hymeniacidonis]|uniref:NmrA-like domain-containing protein n=1 Tax=Actinoalloteichus hymeniacidonis TaxID=340345 RepID=A0AAC9MY17_9PSEU|nr:NmrA/HSCARG family protein [Actinoalloteichus hymeniacidonis]AOS63943.1 hypothetical protein TL08_15670 [Actinoalloteichus hymeniacidonis]MBB5908000.1 uncharacterized protein YbjT (DUF2867 family) [Actinoalloteichus hymeniacidonis]
MTDQVLVTGATGKQGGAVARALLAAGTRVRALVRDPGSDRAQAVAALGAELVRGDLNDPATLQAATTGVRAVFSVQTPVLDDLDSDGESVRGTNLVRAAYEAGVEQFVHTSVSGAGEHHRTAPGWAEGRWNRHYWESKAVIDDLVREVGFPYWTVLKPAGFMENLLEWSPLFGDWKKTGFITAFAADTRLSFVAVQDIGAAAAAVFADPRRFHGLDVELAGDLLTMTEMAAVLAEVSGRQVDAPVLTSAEAIERGLDPMIVSHQEWLNEVGAPARPEHAHALGLTTTDFRTWAWQSAGPACTAGRTRP